jgi:hypothetical protein
LLEETEDGLALSRLIRSRVALLDERAKVSDAEYIRRLVLCESCDQLSSGTCMQCGCYVQLRAAKRALRCAHPQPKW